MTRGLAVERLEEAAEAAVRWAAFPLVRRERGERWMRKLGSVRGEEVGMRERVLGLELIVSCHRGVQYKKSAGSMKKERVAASARRDAKKKRKPRVSDCARW